LTFTTNSRPGVGVGVLLGVDVGVCVGVEVGVDVGVRVAVDVGVCVTVGVGVCVGVDVGVAVDVAVGDEVGVRVGVPLSGHPLRAAVTAVTISSTVTNLSPLPSAAGHVFTSRVPSAMFTIETSSSTVT
jgi:hypothetical protein